MAEGTTPALKHPNVRKYLKELVPNDIRQVGVELGLYQSHLKRMNDESLLDDMVPCWLREDDDVHETSGTPSWESLAKALERAGFNGVAANIRKACAVPVHTLEASVSGRDTRVPPGPAGQPPSSVSSRKLQANDLTKLLDKLGSYAYKWKDIGLGLGFTYAELRTIENIPRLFNEASLGYLREMLSDWLQWAPGDARGSTDYATLQALKKAVDKAGLGRLAQELSL